jgi:hypothetical protein
MFRIETSFIYKRSVVWGHYPSNLGPAIKLRLLLPQTPDELKFLKIKNEVKNIVDALKNVGAVTRKGKAAVCIMHFRSDGKLTCARF